LCHCLTGRRTRDGTQHIHDRRTMGPDRGDAPLRGRLASRPRPGSGSRTSGLRIIFLDLSCSVCVVSISRSSGLKSDFQPLVEPSLPALDILIPSHSTIISSPARYWTCGCGHGGTRYISTSRRVHTWSVNPAAIAGVWGRHCLTEPVPWVGSGWGSAWRKEAWARQKL
jgi:hypothetical protein